MTRSVIFLVLIMCQPASLLAQKEVTVGPRTLVQQNSADFPKRVIDPTAGTWKYKVVPAVAKGNSHATFSISIMDDGGGWTITTVWEFPAGPVTDVSTYEKGTLLLRKESRKESFDYFLHNHQPWKPVAINLDFNGNKVTGIMRYAGHPDKPVAMDLGGPAFASSIPELMIGCLPLADGYSTAFRYFDIDRLPIKPQASNRLIRLKVVGTERVTVPAGTFDTYKVELTSADSGSNKEIAWIAKDPRIMVKVSVVDELHGVGTMELAP